ncbi:interferon alpha-1/13-like [Pelodytes ibericus]
MAVFTATMVKTLLTTLTCTYLLVSSCYPTALSLQCNNVYRLQSTMNKETLKHLAKMKEKMDHSDVDCPPQDFQSPLMNNTLMVTEVNLRYIIHQINKIFNNNLSEVTTDKDAAETTDMLQILLSEMLKLWTDCLYKDMTLRDFKIHNQPKKNIKIKMYFQRMETYLKTENYSICAWAAVRAEVHKTMRLVTKNTDLLSKSH